MITSALLQMTHLFQINSIWGNEKLFASQFLANEENAYVGSLDNPKLDGS